MRYLVKHLKLFLSFFSVYISRKPLKFYYELENEIKDNLIISSSGILHIGAHYGQEAKKYFDLSKEVIWIEALPQVYEELLKNIEQFENQIAVCALLGDISKADQLVNLSNNDFSASSIFQMHPKSGFHGVEILDSICLPMTTLDEVLEGYEISKYSYWVLDVQGAELLVLKGSVKALKFCNYILVESSTRPTYIGGAQYHDLKKFLETHGFFPLWEPLQNDHTDIQFIRRVDLH
jgi:FkbM family methyltransferase